MEAIAMTAKSKSRHISSRRRGYPVIDRVCQIVLFAGLLTGMYSMISYANQRDIAALSQHDIAVIIEH